MVSNNLVETSRMAVQKELDSKRLHTARRDLGQFATPHSLAMEMLKYAYSKTGDTKIRFLDPGFGTGSFYSALLNVFERENIEKAVGFEIDELYWKAAIDLWDHEPPLQLMKGDFTRIEPPTTDQCRFNLIICNPPYVRHHSISSSEKKRLSELIEKRIGIKPSGYTGLYCYFLLLSHDWLSRDGIAGWLIPSEFMDVNYGKQIKDYLLTKVTLLRIHRFDPSEVQFNDALVSSAIVWVKNSPAPANHEVEFSYGGTLSKPLISKWINVQTLLSLRKWSGLPRINYAANSLDQCEMLENYFTIKRGIATGANEFFILSKEKAAKLQISKQFLKKVLPPPRNLRTTLIEECSSDGQELFLLSCDLPETEIKNKYPDLWDYLEEGKAKGVNERYITSHRTPWYLQENRPAAPLLFNIMGRPENSKTKPYRFILNKTSATATNVYLMLYPKPHLKELLDKDAELLGEIWTKLNEIPLSDLLQEGRVYGGGLYKIEPKELRRVCSKPLSQLILKHQKQKNALLKVLR